MVVSFPATRSATASMSSSTVMTSFSFFRRDEAGDEVVTRISAAFVEDATEVLSNSLRNFSDASGVRPTIAIDQRLKSARSAGVDTEHLVMTVIGSGIA